MQTVHRALLAAAIGLITAVPTIAEDEPALDLAQRRAIKQYQEGSFAKHEAAIKAAVKPDLELVVDWPKIALPGLADRYNEPEFWDQIFFEPLAAALQQVGADEMGKTALAGKLKKIRITFDEATAPASNYPNGVSFQDGVLTINFHPYSNSGGPDSTDFKERVKAIVGALETGL